jgi:hypothetical protein
MGTSSRRNNRVFGERGRNPPVARILVGQDVRDVGDMVEKFTGTPPGCRG